MQINYVKMWQEVPFYGIGIIIDKNKTNKF